MKRTDFKEIIRASGKRGIVAYKGKDKRKQFDESVDQKKVNLVSSFIGSKIEEIFKILN
ncbi:hypothetical protein [Chryseobacterium indologenes]|uniref:hypothetical protein n=1 Tax=Chryseobacterium indologenes TaxID=253 RepID=UPI001628B53F|nr:hypothetical protein [Chryseobacterium indologenes]